MATGVAHFVASALSTRSALGRLLQFEMRTILCEISTLRLRESTMHDDSKLWTTVWVLFGTSFVGGCIVASAIGLL
jgi:hypothetical protein